MAERWRSGAMGWLMAVCEPERGVERVEMV